MVPNLATCNYRVSGSNRYLWPVLAEPMTGSIWTMCLRKRGGGEGEKGFYSNNTPQVGRNTRQLFFNVDIYGLIVLYISCEKLAEFLPTRKEKVLEHFKDDSPFKRGSICSHLQRRPLERQRQTNVRNFVL